jgi:hypothetical protein
MFQQLADVVYRCRLTLIEDAAGAVALVALLFGILHLPVFV